MMKALCLFVCASIVLLAAGGCSTAAKGPSDMEALQKVMNDCAAVAATKDISKLMTYFSETFQSSGSASFDKPGFKDFLDGAKDSGLLDGLEIDLKDAKPVIQNGVATVTPIHVHVNAGAPEAAFTAKKEKGVWKITEMEISGI